MKIALISTTVLPSKPYRLYSGYGGLEKVVGSLAEELVKLGHSVTLIGCDGSEAQGCRVVPVPRGTADEQLIAQSEVAGALEEADVWYDHSWPHWPAVWRTDGRYQDKKLLIMHHGVLGDITQPPPTCVNWVCASNAQSQAISMALGITTRVAHHGVDHTVFCPGGKREDYALICSRLSPEKGVLQAVQAVKRAKQRLVVIADDEIVADRAYARRVLDECDGYQTRFISGTRLPLEAQLAWMQSAKCLVHTPLSPWIEIFGLVVAESLACGTPVVATANGAIPEIVTNGVQGLLVQHTDELPEALRLVDQIDPLVCRARVLERFTLQHMAARHAALLDETAQGMLW